MTRADLRTVCSLALLAAVLLAGCSEEPSRSNALVADLPLDEFTVKDTTVSADTSGTFRTYQAMNGSINMLGSYGRYTACLAIQFTPSAFPTRDTIVVHQATLMLSSATWTGDSLGTLSFTAHRVERGWSASRLTWDSIQTGFFESAERGRYVGAGGPDSQMISLDLDTAMVREWFRSSGTTKYGIILVPAAPGGLIRGFFTFGEDSSAIRPTLRVIAGNVSGTSRDTSTFVLGTDTFVANIDELAADPGLIYLQAGVVYRGNLRFDTGFLPRGAIVNQAELLLERDAASSHLTRFTADTVVSAHMLLSNDPAGIFESDFYSSAGRRLAGTSTTFRFDVRHAVQTWARGGNYGFLLRVATASEFNSLDLYCFGSVSAPDPARRPRLRVVYSVRNQGGG